MGLACLYYLFLFVLMDSAASDLMEDINSCCDSDESRDASDSNSHDPREWSVDSSENEGFGAVMASTCLLYTSPSPRDGLLSRMPSSA